MQPSDMSGAPPPPPYVGPAQDYNTAPAQPYAQQPPYAAQPYVAAPGQMDMHAPGADPTKGAVAMAPPMAGAPPPGGPAPVGEVKFSTGLCDCCEGPQGIEGCLVAWLVPCWAQGVIGDVVADGVGRVPPCSLTLGLYGIIWVGSCFAGVCHGVNAAFQIPAAIGLIVVAAFGRKKMREKYGIPGNCCPGGNCLRHSPPPPPLVSSFCLKQMSATNSWPECLSTAISYISVYVMNRVMHASHALNVVPQSVSSEVRRSIERQCLCCRLLHSVLVPLLLAGPGDAPHPRPHARPRLPDPREPPGYTHRPRIYEPRAGPVLQRQGQAHLR